MKTITRICLATLFLGLPMVVGCGGSNEPEVVSGVTTDFLSEIEQGQAEYAQSMEGEKDKKPGQ